MSKEIYVVNCYTCQHNGQETCKGCNTLLNGDVEPYENWELREDLSQKDHHIAELEQELAGLKIKVNNRNKKIENQRKEIINLQKHIIKLKSCGIIPKFKVGQEVWHIITAKPMRDFIVRNDMHQYELGISKFGVYEDFLFATEQEAQDKLKEIQGNE